MTFGLFYPPSGSIIFHLEDRKIDGLNSFASKVQIPGRDYIPCGKRGSYTLIWKTKSNCKLQIIIIIKATTNTNLNKLLFLKAF
jgi:hypothetical protein